MNTTSRIKLVSMVKMIAGRCVILQDNLKPDENVVRQAANGMMMSHCGSEQMLARVIWDGFNSGLSVKC